MIEHLFLDWSGTLADDLAPVVNATNRVLTHYGAPTLTREQFRSSFRLPFVHFWDHALPHVSLEEIEETYHSYFVELQHSVELLPGARELLEACHRDGLQVYLLSSIKPAHFEKQAALLGVTDAFHSVHTGVYDKCMRLPQILTEREIPSSSAMYVGDMVHDIDAARAANVIAVAVLSGYDPIDKLRAAKPDALIENVSCLPPFLGLGKTRPPILVAGAWIKHPVENRFLLCRTTRCKHKWGIPTVPIRNGEHAVDVVRHKILREAGLDLQGVRFGCLTESISDSDDLPSRHIVLLNYFATATRSDIAMNAVAQQFIWATLDECRNMEVNTPTAMLLSHLAQSRIPHE